jgi:predicted nucleic acid-binding protein
MPVFYLDTSAILKRYRTERGTDVVNELYESQTRNDALITSHFSCLEFESVAARALKGNLLSREAYNVMLGSFADDLTRSLHLIEMDGETINYAVVGAREHGLRAGDALQFGAAYLGLKRSPGLDYVFVGSDKELARAVAGFTDLEVLNPEADGAMERLERLRRE